MDFLRRSLPARSTMYRRPTLAFMDTLSAPVALPGEMTARLATVSSTSACERLECAFSFVKA